MISVKDLETAVFMHGDTELVVDEVILSTNSKEGHTIVLREVTSKVSSPEPSPKPSTVVVGTSGKKPRKGIKALLEDDECLPSEFAIKANMTYQQVKTMIDKEQLSYRAIWIGPRKRYAIKVNQADSAKFLYESGKWQRVRR